MPIHAMGFARVKGGGSQEFATEAAEAAITDCQKAGVPDEEMFGAGGGDMLEESLEDMLGALSDIL